MKSLLSCILLSVLFISNARSQKIDFSLDTTQLQLQESDAGAADFADIDGDGDQDLIIIGKTPIKTRLYKNDGNGNFSEVENTPFIDVFAGNVAFADVDGDSDFDVLITGNDRRPLPNANLYLNDGKGNFTLQANSTFHPCLGGDVAFAHLNEDSAIDLVINGQNSNGESFTQLYLNDGKGVFTTNQTPYRLLDMQQLKFLILIMIHILM